MNDNYLLVYFYMGDIRTEKFNGSYEDAIKYALNLSKDIHLNVSVYSFRGCADYYGYEKYCEE